MGSRPGQRASKGACLVVPPLFRADSGMNMSKVGHWLNNSVVSRITRGPGFESRAGKKSWPDRDSNPGPLAYRASTLPTEIPSHIVVLWHFPPA